MDANETRAIASEHRPQTLKEMLRLLRGDRPQDRQRAEQILAMIRRRQLGL